MIRLFVLALVLAAAATASVAHAALLLRPEATVSSAVIRVGDLFDGAGSHARDPVAAAPPPGMRITFGADWLVAMARAHQLDWRPASAYDQATVVRASRTIEANTIARQLMSDIAQSRPVDGAELRLDNPDLSLVVPAGTPDALAIEGLDIDPGSLRFSAFVSAPPGDPAAARQRVTGQLIYRVEVPVLSHPMGPGAIIAADDIEMVKLRRNRLPQDAAGEVSQLIGRTPRRPLAADAPIALGDVERPVLVHRGDLVTVVLQTSSLQLTAQGKALEDGAENALVRVENTKSNRVIDAAVAGPDLVAVKVPGAAALPALISSR